MVVPKINPKQSYRSGQHCLIHLVFANENFCFCCSKIFAFLHQFYFTATFLIFYTNISDFLHQHFWFFTLTFSHFFHQHFCFFYTNIFAFVTAKFLPFLHQHFRFFYTNIFAFFTQKKLKQKIGVKNKKNWRKKVPQTKWLHFRWKMGDI